MDGGVMELVYTDTDKSIHRDADGVEHTDWHHLRPEAIAATLNACLGVWPLADAANACGVPADRLVFEAEAWAAAATE